MKSTILAGIMAIVSSGVVVAQNPTAPVLPQQGIQVRLAVSNQAVATPDADRADATVVTVTAEGNLYVGTEPTNVAFLAGLHGSTIYVKADAQAEYQQVLAVLSALGNQPLVLLTQPTATAEAGKLLPPYGVSLTIGRP